MKRLLTLLFLFFLVLVFFSCHHTTRSGESSVANMTTGSYLPVKTIEVGNVKAGISVLPWQIMATRFTKRRQNDASALKLLKGKYYFVLSLSANGRELLRQLPFEQYSQIVQTLAFRLRPLVRIVAEGGKIIGAEDCFFQQTYGMARENEILLVFDRSKLSNCKDMILTIKEFGLNTGDLNYNIQNSDHSSPIIN